MAKIWASRPRFGACLAYLKPMTRRERPIAGPRASQTERALDFDAKDTKNAKKKGEPARATAPLLRRFAPCALAETCGAGGLCGAGRRRFAQVGRGLAGGEG